jgi:trimeric autotransporter adhesin
MARLNFTKSTFQKTSIRFMYKLFSSTILTLIISTGFAQLTGIKIIPGSYPSLSAAVTDLNTQGVGTGGVTFNLAAGYTEVAPAGGILLTATGTAANPILFQKSGSGSNPKITSTDAGSVATAVFGGQGDAILTIQGSDYVTFDGIDVAASQSSIEYGYYLRKASSTNGCKNVIIKSCSITLTKGTSPFVVGIYVSNNSSSSLTSSNSGITVTTTGGLNENITIIGNNISNVFTGLALIGYNAPSPYNLYDQNITVGTDNAGNIIQNYAGSTTAPSYGVYTLYIKSANVSYNTIANSSGGGTAATGALYGVYFDINSSGAGDYVVNNNSFNMSQASTAILTCIYNGSATTTFAAVNNSFGIGSFASTSDSYLIYNSNATASTVVSNNQTIGTINKTGAGNFTCYLQTGNGPTGTTSTCSGNNFSNISVTGYYNFTGINHTNIASQIVTITNNTISNIIGNGANNLTGISVTYGKDNSVISGNTVSSFSGAYVIVGLLKYIGTSSNPITVSNNNISNLTAIDYVYGMTISGSNNIFKNKVFGLTASSNTGIAFGIGVGVGTNQSINVYNNLIGNLNTPAVNSTADAIRGINLMGTSGANASMNVSFNTIYINATSSGANFSTSAIYHAANSNPTVDVMKLVGNILVNTSTAKGSGTTVVIRRSGSTLNNYSFNSNNNLLYAGTPSTANLLYYDGLNAYSSLSDFKSFVASRESASVTELPPFITTDGSLPNYLHIAPGSGTQANNGGTPVAGIVDDYDGQLRSTTTPDIGADEFDVALPIKFEYLKGKKVGTGNALTWKVTCTSATITMVLERSADGRTFNQTVTSITATQARCGQPFDYTDATPLAGTNYYRLKMIDIDGTVSYSPVVALLNGRAGAELVGIYPTIVHSQAMLSITSSRSTSLQFTITDMSGKVVKTISQSVGTGSSLLPISTSGLATGVYNISGVLDGVRTQTLRFVKQ